MVSHSQYFIVAAPPKSPKKENAAAGGAAGRRPRVDNLVPGGDNFEVYDEYNVKLNQTNIG